MEKTMRIERRWLETVFRKVTPESVYNSIINDDDPLFKKYSTLYNNFTRDSFFQFSKGLYSNYSKDEIDNIYDMMIDTANFNSFCPKSLFNLLVSYAEKVLVTDDRFPVVNYNEILNWREMTNKLGQDIFTTAYLAYSDINNCETTKVFSWDAVLKTNNNRLHNILNKGMSENHFHLHGSTRVFTLSWICDMNYFEKISSICEKFDKPLSRYEISSEKISNTITKELQQAAIIRALLFKRIFISDNDTIGLNELKKLIDEPLLSDFKNQIKALRTSMGYKIENCNNILDYSLVCNLNEENYNLIVH